MKFTHKGILRGYDARTPKHFRMATLLRETKLYWVDTKGRKYRKDNLVGVGDWPLFQLMERIERISEI